MEFATSDFYDGEDYQAAPYFYIDDYEDGTFGSIPLSVSDITWSSGNTQIVTVTNKGLFHALKAGTATITLKYGGFTTTFTMTVNCNHQYTHSAVVNNQTTVTCTKCGHKATVTVPTNYVLFWKNNESEDPYYYTGLPLYNPTGSSLECWLYDINGTDGYNYLLIQNSDRSVLRTPGRIQPGETLSFQILKKGLVNLKIYSPLNENIYMEVSMIFGDDYMWFSNGYGWTCFYKGSLVNGWQQIDGYTYFFIDGVQQTGWLSFGSDYYYFNPSTGAMAVGWQWADGTYYYFNPSNGVMTGWLIYQNRMYFYDTASGSFKTGWLLYNNNLYYFNPATAVMWTGWLSYGGKYYYFNPSTGALQVGWVWVPGQSTYFYIDPSSGAMTGWLVYQNNTYFYDTAKGSFRTGWLSYNGYWFYLNPSTGIMVTGKQVIGGKTYTFNAYGVCIG